MVFEKALNVHSSAPPGLTVDAALRNAWSGSCMHIATPQKLARSNAPTYSGWACGISELLVVPSRRRAYLPEYSSDQTTCSRRSAGSGWTSE